MCIRHIYNKFGSETFRWTCSFSPSPSLPSYLFVLYCTFPALPCVTKLDEMVWMASYKECVVCRLESKLKRSKYLYNFISSRYGWDEETDLKESDKTLTTIAVARYEVKVLEQLLTWQFN